MAAESYGGLLLFKNIPRHSSYRHNGLRGIGNANQ